MSCTWFYLLYFFLSRIATKPTKSSKRNSPWAVQQPACQSPPWRSCTPSTSVWARSDVSHQQRPLTDPKHWTPQPEDILRFRAMPPAKEPSLTFSSSFWSAAKPRKVEGQCQGLQGRWQAWTNTRNKTNTWGSAWPLWRPLLVNAWEKAWQVILCLKLMLTGA